MTAQRIVHLCDSIGVLASTLGKLNEETPPVLRAAGWRRCDEWSLERFTLPSFATGNAYRVRDT